MVICSGIEPNISRSSLPLCRDTHLRPSSPLGRYHTGKFYAPSVSLCLANLERPTLFCIAGRFYSTF